MKQTAEEIIMTVFGKEYFIANDEDDIPRIKEAMIKHTRQALEEFRKECAEKACIDLGDGQKLKYYLATDDLGNEFGITVSHESILSLDIEKYLK